jgi:hypothetical protein
MASREACHRVHASARSSGIGGGCGAVRCSSCLSHRGYECCCRRRKRLPVTARRRILGADWRVPVAILSSLVAVVVVLLPAAIGLGLASYGVHRLISGGSPLRAIVITVGGLSLFVSYQVAVSRWLKRKSNSDEKRGPPERTQVDLDTFPPIAWRRGVEHLSDLSAAKRGVARLVR